MCHRGLCAVLTADDAEGPHHHDAHSHLANNLDRPVPVRAAAGKPVEYRGSCY